jgi:hypothetical protein
MTNIELTNLNVISFFDDDMYDTKNPNRVVESSGQFVPMLRKYSYETQMWMLPNSLDPSYFDTMTIGSNFIEESIFKKKLKLTEEQVILMSLLSTNTLSEETSKRLQLHLYSTFNECFKSLDIFLPIVFKEWSNNVKTKLTKIFDNFKFFNKSFFESFRMSTAHHLRSANMSDDEFSGLLTTFDNLDILYKNSNYMMSTAETYLSQLCSGHEMVLSEICQGLIS